MTGDFSRHTFDRTKHYSAVLMQQGRVQVDADWNEEQEIGYDREVRTARDEIGGCGYPSSEASSFQIGIAAGGKDLTIGPGRMYVSGVLCENESAGTLLKQTDLPLPTGALAEIPDISKAGAPQPGIYLAYLDVWRRHITALEDPQIREKALGGPDTSTRVKTVWQVKVARAADRGAAVTCSTAALPVKPADCGMTASVAPSAAAGPCVLPPQTGYRRLENQLYRVEIHKPGKVGEATFKWSRENGSVTAGITGAAGSWTIPVQSAGRDTELGIGQGQWVELLDDRIELSGAPGTLYQVAKVTPAANTVDLQPSGSAPSFAAALHPKLRLWNQQGGSEIAGGIPVTAAAIQLEDGIQVQFSGTFFAAGDHWLIPARTAIDNTVGNIEWPVDASNNPAVRPPCRVEHRYCALALVDFDGTQFLPINGAVPDCRQPFDDLVTLTKRKAGGCCTVSIGPEDLTGNTTLQSILDLQQGNGKVTICLKPGTYTLPGTLKLGAGHANFTIEGCPEGAVIKGAPDAQAAFADGLISIVSTSGIKLRRLRLELPLAPYPLGQFSKTTYSAVGIRTVDCAELTVQNCEFAIRRGADRTLFAVGIFASGTSKGWCIERNRFSTPQLSAPSSADLPQIGIGLLIHPGIQAGAAVNTGAGTLQALVRSALGGSVIADNRFEGLQFAVLSTADSGSIRCADNVCLKCNEGFWFLSLQALALLAPDQEITYDPQYEQELIALLALFGAYFQDANYLRAFLFSLYYSMPRGWTPSPATTPSAEPAAMSISSDLVARATLATQPTATLATQPAATTPSQTTQPAAGQPAAGQPSTAQPAPTKPAAPAATTRRNAWQLVADTSITGIRNIKGAQTPTAKTVKVSDLLGIKVDPSFSFLGNLILEPTLSLNLEFSGNEVDLGAGADQIGTGLLVVDSDRATNSVLCIGSNRMRTFSSKTPVASAWAVDRCAISGNIMANDRATPSATPSRGVAGPWSLVVVPPPPDQKTPAGYAITGNVLLGSTTFALIPRNFPAPLNTWSFANTEL